ncbi:LysM peptidoglycan-binding domain-containing protein [Lysobacter claricitrinus]|uniref:LysM peptidoglycan-binding domain-containing protein n=1 Tax=Lysobacter claricitrinus TaxID=3367728 RepID=UPI0038B2CECE
MTTTPPTAATNEPQQITPRVVPPAPALQASNAQPAQTPATSPAAVAPTPTATQRTYTVQQGDSLSKIAKHVYGDAERWHLIFDANRERISDPDRIYPGQVLMLPDPPSLH